MKIAIVHDGLMCRAGGERVVLHFHQAFPTAPIYTLCYQPELTYSEFKECDIRTSWFQKFVSTEKQMKSMFFPLGILAMSQMDVTDYDIVLMSGTHCAKYVRTSSNAVLISYTYTPFRLAWNPDSYAEFDNANFLKRLIFKQVITVLKKIDYFYSQKINYFLAMTEETKQRVIDSYHPKAEIQIIKPAIDVSAYYVSQEIGDYFLIVSRMEYYKKVDLAIEAFNIMGLKLIVVGNGTKKEEFKVKAKENIVFLEGISNSDLATLYAKCRAFVFPQHEDYGLTAIEANASGRPVIAYGEGGILDTQLPFTNDASQATALFFKNQTVEDLINAIKLFEKLNFDSSFIKKHSENFKESLFIEKIYEVVMQKYEHIISEKIA